MTNDRVVELEKEVRELNLKLEIERQKVRKLEQENQKLKDKLTRQMRSERPLRVAAAPGGVPSGGGMDTSEEEMMQGGVSEEEIDEMREKLRTLTSQKDASEQEKWDQSKEVIEHKENLQRLRVKKINIKKDIDELNERLDRKENQNFKSRLELTDLKKEERKTKSVADEAEQDRIRLEEKIAQLEGYIEKENQKLREEKVAFDKVNYAMNRSQRIKAEYESHFLARFYNK